MDLKNYPRVLIVTVNPLSSTSNNGKTFASFFEGYPKECIAQLYFHREIPTSNVCDNYYKISDEDIINNILKRSENIGGKVYREAIVERLIPENINNKLKKSSMARFARSLLWKSLELERGDVRRWLDNFNPEIIFFCGGDANYLYTNVLKISKNYNAKIIYYITDDYVIPYFTFHIFDSINRIWTRKVFKKICSNSSLVLTIGDKMSRVYKEKYGVESKKIMNLVKIEANKIKNTNFKKNDLKFVYTGGLHSNRWKTLSLIGESLERLDRQGIKAKLEIYSQDKPEDKILKQINNKNYSKFCGSLDEHGVKKVLNEADVLVHVESFDPHNKIVTYLSISTKIPEYMSMGKCIVAIGPHEVASMEYIKENDFGYVITSTETKEIDNIIKEIILNPDKRKAYIERALVTVKQNHDAEVKRKEFQQSIINLNSSK